MDKILVKDALTEIMMYVTDILKEQSKAIEKIQNEYDTLYPNLYYESIARGDLCVDILGKISELMKKYQ